MTLVHSQSDKVNLPGFSFSGISINDEVNSYIKKYPNSKHNYFLWKGKIELSLEDGYDPDSDLVFRSDTSKLLPDGSLDPKGNYGDVSLLMGRGRYNIELSDSESHNEIRLLSLILKDKKIVTLAIVFKSGASINKENCLETLEELKSSNGVPQVNEDSSKLSWSWTKKEGNLNFNCSKENIAIAIFMNRGN